MNHDDFVAGSYACPLKVVAVIACSSNAFLLLNQCWYVLVTFTCWPNADRNAGPNVDPNVARYAGFKAGPNVGFNVDQNFNCYAYPNVDPNAGFNPGFKAGPNVDSNAGRNAGLLHRSLVLSMLVPVESLSPSSHGLQGSVLVPCKSSWRFCRHFMDIFMTILILI